MAAPKSNLIPNEQLQRLRALHLELYAAVKVFLEAPAGEDMEPLANLEKIMKAQRNQVPKELRY